MKFRLLLSTMILAITTGCASIMHGTTQDIGISSNPTNAIVTINGESRGNTPMTVDLRRKDNHLVRMELPGHLPYETTLTRSVSGWVWGNIVFGGLIGLAVDGISGGLYKLTPEQISAELRSGDASMFEGPSDDALYLFVVLEADPTWEQVGRLDDAS